MEERLIQCSADKTFFCPISITRKKRPTCNDLQHKLQLPFIEIRKGLPSTPRNTMHYPLPLMWPWETGGKKKQEGEQKRPNKSQFGCNDRVWRVLSRGVSALGALRPYSPSSLPARLIARPVLLSRSLLVRTRRWRIYEDGCWSVISSWMNCSLHDS